MAARTVSIFAFSALLLAAHGAPAAADLTDTERRWLAGATPPVAWALKQGMPIDIVVLPQAEAGAAPIAMGYDEGRCKLVFAMRGNPAAESTLAAIPAPLLQATLDFDLYGELQFDRKQLNDDIDVSSIHTDRHLDNWTANLSGDQRDAMIDEG